MEWHVKFISLSMKDGYGLQVVGNLSHASSFHIKFGNANYNVGFGYTGLTQIKFKQSILIFRRTVNVQELVIDYVHRNVYLSPGISAPFCPDRNDMKADVN